jgi:hypothetical protein
MDYLNDPRLTDAERETLRHIEEAFPGTAGSMRFIRDGQITPRLRDWVADDET